MSKRSGRPSDEGRTEDEWCRCGLLPQAPAGARHWWPSRDPEPEPDVRAVTLCGQDPAFLREVRLAGGWHTQGAAASHAHLTPPGPWSQTGLCWALVEHPVVDVTTFLQASDTAHTKGATRPRPTP